MKDTEKNMETGNKKHGKWPKALKVTAWIAAGIVGLLIVCLVGLEIYLTPERTTRLFNKYTTEYLKADFNAKRVDLHFFRGFPFLSIGIDSLEVRSRTLDSIPKDYKPYLPAKADSLGTVDRLVVEVNVLDALRNVWNFRRIQAKGLGLNLVKVNDSINNYNIIPPELGKNMKVPRFRFNEVRVLRMKGINYASLSELVKANVNVGRLIIKEKTGDSYQLALNGKLSASVKDLPVLKEIPVEMYGDVKTSFNPFAIRLIDCYTGVAGIGTNLNCSLKLGGTFSIDSFSANIGSLDLLSLWQYVTEMYLPEIENLADYITLDSSVVLSEPYIPSKPGSVPVLDLSVKRLELHGPYSNLVIAAKILDILGDNPEISANVNGKADMCLISRFVPQMKGYDVRGVAYADVRGNIRMPLNSDNIALEGVVNLENVKVASPDREWSLDVPNAECRLGAAGLDNDVATFYTGKSALKYDAMDLSLDRATGVLSLDSLLAVNLKAEGIAAGHRKHNEKFSAFNARLDMKASPKHTDLKLVADTLAYSRSGVTCTLKTLDIGMKVKDTYHVLDELARTGILDACIKCINPNLNIRATGGMLLDKAYPAYNRLSNLDVSLNNDVLTLKDLSVRSQNSSLKLNGSLAGVNALVKNRTNKPVKIRAFLDVDTLNLNEIAFMANAGAKLAGKDTATPKEMPPVTAADTMTLLFPRNFDVLVVARAKACEYTNLNLTDLSARATLKNGVLDLDTFRMTASFGKAMLHYLLDTSDAEHLKMNLKMSLDDFNVVAFFRKYQDVLAMMPQMKNLSGYLGGTVEANMEIFPSMYVNFPSVNARVTAYGRHLVVNQNHFIRNVTRLMLIPTSSPLHIENINVSANIHDCLLELYPFDVAFSRYRVRMMGINDFQGHLNYHINILHSPIPLPFGIHIGGMYHTPKVTLGGTNYNIDGTIKEMKIEQNDSMNVMQQTRYYLRKFMNNASGSVNAAKVTYAFPEASSK